MRLLAVWLGWSASARAAPPERAWTTLAYPPAFEHISVEQGLSQSSVHTIAQDKMGFLWMGTDAGLNRYDGFRFQLFHPANDQRSLAGDWVERIVPDMHGYLWIAARNAGLTLLDPESLAMVQIPISSQPGGLPSRTVNSILQDRDGSVWIGTESDGLFRVHADWSPPAEPRFERIVSSTDGRSAPKHRVSALFLDHADALWLASPERGLGRLVSGRHGGPLAFDYYPHDANHPLTSCPSMVNAIAEDALGMIWLGSDDGLYMFDPGSAHFTRWTSSQFIKGIGRVTDILRDTKDTLWVAGDGLGLFKALPRQHRNDPVQFEHFEHDPKNAGSLSRNGLQCVFEDRSGMLWVSSYQGGLNKVVLNPASLHDRERPSVFQYRNNAADPWSLSGDNVSAIGADRFGNLWIGTDGFGLNRLATPGDPREPARFERFRDDPTHVPGSLQTDVILTIHLDSHKQIWLGSYLGGLVRVDQTSPTARPTFTHFKHHPQDPDSLPSDFIRDIVDDGGGGFWIAFDGGGGLGHFDPRSGKTKHYDVGEGPRALKNGNLMRIVQDRFATLWIATQFGLHRFNPRTEEFRVYLPGGPEGLSDIFINTLYLAPAGTLWIGTKSGGLNRTEVPPWEGREPRFSVYGKPDGLPEGAVMSILPDSKGHLWLAIHRALCQFDTGTLKASTFTFQRELRKAEFIWNAAYLGLTGLRNRRFLDSSMPEWVATVQRQQRAVACGEAERTKLNIDIVFIMLDIDHFKQVNDQYGHQAGDRVLQQFGEILRTVTRGTDTVARWGGEEFLIVARNAARGEAATLAKRIRVAVEKHTFDVEEGKSLHCTCSLGFSVFPLVPGDTCTFSWEQTVAIADACLYAAKHNGRNAWVGIAPMTTPESKTDIPHNPAELVRSKCFTPLSSIDGPIKWTDR